MPTPHPITWLPDDDTLFLWESNPSTGSPFVGPGPVVLDSGPLAMVLSPTGSPASTTGVTGNGRSFPAGDNKYFLTSSGWVSRIRVTKQMTVEGMVRMEVPSGATYPFIYLQNHAGNDQGAYILLDINGKIEVRYHADGGDGYYDIPPIVVPSIPGANYVHLRSTCDWIAQEIKFWAGPPGQPLTLLATLSTPAGLNFFNGTDVFSDAVFGNVFGNAAPLSGLDKVRISQVVRTDFFPNPFGSSSSAFNQGFN